MAKLALLVEGKPTVAVHVVDLETIRIGLENHPEIAPFEQGAFVQQSEQAIDPPALVVELRVVAGHADGEHGKRDHHGHDHHDDQDLDEGEAPVPHAGAADRAPYRASSVAVLMSASYPSPPGLPSRP